MNISGISLYRARRRSLTSFAGVSIFIGDITALAVCLVVLPLVFIVVILIARRVSLGLLLLTLSSIWFFIVSMLNKRAGFRY